MDVVAAVARLDALRLRVGDRPGAGGLGHGEVVVVECVLRPVVAAEHAFADEGAAPARDAVAIRPPLLGIAEGHREVGAHRGLDDVAPRREVLDERRALGDAAGPRVGAGRGDLQHVGREVVVGVERFAAQVRGPAGVERPVRGAGEHVGVDERSASPSGGLHAGHAVEPADVVEPAARLPEPSLAQVRIPGEVAGPPSPAAFEDQHGVAGLGEPRGGHGAPESAADHDHVGVHALGHGVPLPGCVSRGQGRTVPAGFASVRIT